MEIEQVRQYYKIFEDILENATKVIALIQENCPHPTPTKKYQGSVGNWDRDDSYWICWNCPDCKKRWVTSQNNTETDKYPNAVQIK